MEHSTSQVPMNDSEKTNGHYVALCNHEIARVRYQFLNRQFGSVRIGSGVCWSLGQFVRAGGIVYLRVSPVNNKVPLFLGIGVNSGIACIFM